MKSRKIVGAVGLAAVLVVGTAGAAFADSAHTEYPGGGTWSWGETWQAGTNYLAYSNYFHGSKSHKGTTCINNTSNCNTSGWISAGQWAYSNKLYDYVNTPKRYWDSV